MSFLITVCNGDNCGTDVIFGCDDLYLTDEADLVLILEDGEQIAFYHPWHPHWPTTAEDLICAEQHAGVAHYHENRSKLDQWTREGYNALAKS